MDLTIDELARRAGMTTRNIRAHQTRGLLPRPSIRGRTAYYGHEHLERLSAVRSLQSHGVSLQEMARLFERMPAGRAEELLVLARAAAEPFGAEEPLVVSVDGLPDHWRAELTPALIERIEALPIVRPLGEGRYEILSARVFQAALELAQLGVPFAPVLGLMEGIWGRSEELAEVFVELFMEQVVRRADSLPTSDALHEILEHLRPLAGESVMAVFALTLTQAATAAMEREIGAGQASA